MKKSIPLSTTWVLLICFLVSVQPTIIMGMALQEDVNAKDLNDDTPLHVAIYTKNKKKVLELIHHPNIEINAPNRDGNTAAHYAAFGCSDLEIVELIINAPGIDLNAQNEKGQTPLHLVSINDRVHNKDLPAIVQKFIEAGADPCIEHKGGYTPFEASIFEGRTLVMLELQKHTSKPLNAELKASYDRCMQRYQACLRQQQKAERKGTSFCSII